MKKFILPLLLLLAVGMLVAVESDPSAVVGYVKYDYYTGYSYVANVFPTATDAATLGNTYVASVNAMYKFNPVTQGWISYEYDVDFEEWAGTNFPVAMGDAVLFNCTANGAFYSMGQVPDPYPLVYNLRIGYNYITLPFNKAALNTGPLLADDIGTVPAIYKFNNLTHGWLSAEWDADFEEWAGTFPVAIGDIVLARSSALNTWPVRSAAVELKTSK